MSQIANTLFIVHTDHIEFGEYRIPVQQITSMSLRREFSVVRLFCKDAFRSQNPAMIDFFLQTTEKMNKFAQEILKHYTFRLLDIQELNVQLEEREGSPTVGIAEFTLINQETAKLFHDTIAPVFFGDFQARWIDERVRLTSQQGDAFQIAEKMHLAFQKINPYIGYSMNGHLRNLSSNLFPQLPDDTRPAPSCLTLALQDTYYIVKPDRICKSVCEGQLLKEVVFNLEKKQKLLETIRNHATAIEPLSRANSEKACEYMDLIREIISFGGPINGSDYESLKNQINQYLTYFSNSRLKPLSP